MNTDHVMDELVDRSMADADDLWNLAEELLVEILARLPVISVIRFKATCKRWQSIIESPYFVEFYGARRRKVHHHHHHRDRLLLSRGFDYDELGQKVSCTVYSCPAPSVAKKSDLRMIKAFDISFFDKSLTYDYEGDYSESMLGPLDNGIYCWILLHRRHRGQNHIYRPNSIFMLLNPATREINRLSPFPPQLFAEIAPKRSQVNFGFGKIHNKSGVDYKVVVIVNTIDDDNNNNHDFVSFVYSLQRGSWEKIDPAKAVSRLVNEQGEVQTPRCIRPHGECCPQRFLNGSWHWLEGLLPATYTNNKYSDRVLLFDLVTEEFGFIGGPPHDYLLREAENAVNSGLLLLNDHLAAFYMPLVANLHRNEWWCVGLDVWMLMEYGVADSWTKIYSCETAFRRCFDSLVGICYSATVKDDSTSNDTSDIHIHRIFVDDRRTRQLVSIDDPGHINNHNFYFASHDSCWNMLGVSSYVETLDSLELSPTVDSVQDP